MDFLSLRDVFISLTKFTELKVFEPLGDKIHETHGKFCLSPTDNTDFIDFLPFFHLRLKDRWFGFNNLLFDYVKLLPWVVIIAPFGIV